MKKSTTSRTVPILVLAALLLLPVNATAKGWGRPDLRLGLELGFIMPSEPDIYGQGVVDYFDNSGIAIDYPLDSIISPEFTAYPGISQGLIWENGFGLVLTEKFTIMPLDVEDFPVKFERIIVPVTLTARYEFLRNRSWRPFIGVGPGLYYINSSVDVNEGGYTFEDQNQWEPGFHAVAGVDLFRKKKAGLSFDVRYEYFNVDEYTGFGDLQALIDSLGISSGGNGGGIVFGVGVTFQNLTFVPFKSKP